MQRRAFATMVRVLPLPGHASSSAFSPYVTASRCSSVSFILREPINRLANIVREIGREVRVLGRNLREPCFAESFGRVQQRYVQSHQCSPLCCRTLRHGPCLNRRCDTRLYPRRSKVGTGLL